jgi:hypothetical protein
MGEWMYRSTILDLGTSWRWVVCFTPWPLYPHYPLLGDRVGPRISLDDMERRKSYVYQDSNSDPLAVLPVASRCTDWAVVASNKLQYWTKSWILYYNISLTCVVRNILSDMICFQYRPKFLPPICLWELRISWQYPWGSPSSGMWYHVIWQIITSVLWEICCLFLLPWRRR